MFDHLTQFRVIIVFCKDFLGKVKREVKQKLDMAFLCISVGLYAKMDAVNFISL